LTEYYRIDMYIYILMEEVMAKALRSIRLDDRLVKRAQRVLRAKSRTQAIEMSLEAVLETERHRKLIKRYSGKARPGDFARS
jgi:translation initiation factor 2 alpha subunit (eIF-2alpha)